MRKEIAHLTSTRSPATLTTASCESWDIATAWVNQCMTSHASCTKFSSRQVSPTDRWLPTRLLDLGQSEHDSNIRLVESKDLPSNTEYATLSHCWGAHPVIRLEIASINTFKATIPLGSLPLSFQEAVYVCRKFGIRYLWIDSLCIIQDSLEDWEKEASLMWEVYTNSFLNLAATASADSRGGLFRKRNPLSVKLCRVKATWTPPQPGEYCCIDDESWNREVFESPLNRRAWVVQERLLAPRILHFAADQLYWECSELDASETFPHGLPAVMGKRLKNWDRRNPNGSLSQGLDLYHAWGHLIRIFSLGRLTKQSDKLIAMAGIARQMHKRLGKGDVYLAGLWRQHLAYQMLWEVQHPEYRDEWFGIRPEAYRAPSWSWASIDGVILSGHIPFSDHRDLLVDVVEAATTPVVDHWGPVSDGFVRIRGRLVKARLEAEYENWPALLRLNSVDTLTAKHGYNRVDDGFRDWKTGREVFCMPFRDYILQGKRRISGLLLEPTNAKRGQYRRVGLFVTSGNGCTLLETAAYDDASRELYEDLCGIGRYVITII